VKTFELSEKAPSLLDLYLTSLIKNIDERQRLWGRVFPYFAENLGVRKCSCEGLSFDVVQLKKWGLETFDDASDLGLAIWLGFRYTMSKFGTEVVVICPTPRSNEISYLVDYCYLQTKIAPLVDLQVVLLLPA
jgi:hypothetical protein